MKKNCATVCHIELVCCRNACEFQFLLCYSGFVYNQPFFSSLFIYLFDRSFILSQECVSFNCHFYTYKIWFRFNSLYSLLSVCIQIHCIYLSIYLSLTPIAFHFVYTSVDVHSGRIKLSVNK